MTQVTFNCTTLLAQLAEAPMDTGEEANITTTTLMIMFASLDLQVRKVVIPYIPYHQ